MVQRRPDPAQEAWQLLAELWFGDENHDRFHDACAAAGLSPPQLKGLLSMDPDRPQAMRDLAAHWRCDPSWVTGIVDGLEEKGYAERRPHPTDRRVKTVAITELGEKAKQRALDVLHEPHPAVHALTKNEQRTLRDLLRKVRDASS